MRKNRKKKLAELKNILSVAKDIYCVINKLPVKYINQRNNLHEVRYYDDYSYLLMRQNKKTITFYYLPFGKFHARKLSYGECCTKKMKLIFTHKI